MIPTSTFSSSSTSVSPFQRTKCTSTPERSIDFSGVFSIDLDFDCVPDRDVVIGPCPAADDILTIDRLNPAPDTHPDTIETEIVEMCLTGGGVTVRLGEGVGGITQPTTGEINENAGDPNRAESFFDYFFEFDIEGTGTVYNHAPVRLESGSIDCVPPSAKYSSGPNPICVPLFDDPTTGTHLGNLIFAEHHINDPDNQYVWTKNTTCAELGGACVEHIGACCLGGRCKDDVSESNCFFFPSKKQGQWHKGLTCDEPDIAASCAEKVPAASEWGMAVLVLLVVAGLSIKFGAMRFRRAAQVAG